MSKPVSSPTKGGDANQKKHTRDEGHEEHKNDRGNFEHKPRKHYGKDRINVTLDMVVPELPKKNETLAKPDDDALQTSLDKITKEIDNIYNKIKDVSQDARDKHAAASSDTTLDDLIKLLKQKQDAKKKAYDEFSAVVTERDMYKKQVDEYHDKGNEYRFKMKIPGSKDDLERQLKELKDKQSKGSISLAEEKTLIKEIAELERSLPYAGPLQELETQSKEVRELLKVAKTKTGQKFEVVKMLREECQEIQDKIDKVREENDKKRDETIPKINSIKDDYRNQINDLKKKKRTLIDAHNELWRNYEDQQFEIERIKLIRRKHEKLVRDEVRRKRDEERRKEREAAEAESKEIPYRGQIELAELLIKYCNKLAPSSDDSSSTTASTVDREKTVNEALASDEWKSSKGEVLVSKRDKTDDLFTGKKKAQKKAQPKEVQSTGPQTFPLNHQIETLNYFEEIKVSPPLFSDKLAETLKSLQEKKAYFEKLSSEAIAADEARLGMSEEDRKKFDEEQKAKAQHEGASNESNSRVNRRNNKTAKDINTESEQDFPQMK